MFPFEEVLIHFKLILFLYFLRLLKFKRIILSLCLIKVNLTVNLSNFYMKNNDISMYC